MFSNADNDCKLLENVERLSEAELDTTIKQLIEINVSLDDLLPLFAHVKESIILSNEFKSKCQALHIGLLMVSHIPKCERHTYFRLVHKPCLLVESLLMNECLTILEIIMKECTRLIEQLDVDAQESEGISRSRIDELLRVYADKALATKLDESNHSVSENGEISDTFFPPNSPILAKDWIPDKEAERCMCCEAIVFSIFKRKHHCRRCGRIICHACSKVQSNIDASTKPVRVCEQCFNFQPQPEIIKPEERGARSDSEWILTLNEEDNREIRERFSFKNPPSVSLCLSILELHSHHISVPRFLLAACQKFSKMLRRSVETRQSDVSTYSRMIKSLLLAAKWYYTFLAVPSGIAQCEELESEVELLIKLSRVEFSDFIPGKPVRGISELRRITEVLLAQEHWTLALEICTKAGLDCSGIWYVWGKYCLRNGHWHLAKEKFSRSSLERNASLLDDIFQILCGDSGYLTDTSKRPDRNISEDVYNECIYYLTTYGNDINLLDFFVKNRKLNDAVKLILSKRLSGEVFLDRVYIPCLKGESADLVTLHETMLEIDDNLRCWKEYIRVVCEYCARNHFLKVLYMIQLWLKDYVRAAMTSIKFHLEGACSYRELAVNVVHLHNACSHLENALETAIPDNELVMKMDASEIEKHLNTVYAQLEVTELISENERISTNQITPLPTLFGDCAEKKAVVSLLFDSSDNIRSTFAVAHRLINKYCLDVTHTYGKIAKRLVEQDREKFVPELVQLIAGQVDESAPVIDNILTMAVKSKPAQPDKLISLMSNPDTKISTYIECGLLKSAYLLSVQLNRLDYVSKIALEAEKRDLTAIQRICAQKLECLKLNNITLFKSVVKVHWGS